MQLATRPTPSMSNIRRNKLAHSSNGNSSSCSEHQQLRTRSQKRLQNLVKYNLRGKRKRESIVKRKASFQRRRVAKEAAQAAPAVSDAAASEEEKEENKHDHPQQQPQQPQSESPIASSVYSKRHVPVVQPKFRRGGRFAPKKRKTTADSNSSGEEYTPQKKKRRRTTPLRRRSVLLRTTAVQTDVEV